jgi:2-phospho-L-lactate guanylyltransferase
MTLRIIIPVRPPSEGKTRLAPALKPPARAVLAEAMFRHVLGVAVAVVPACDCLVISRSEMVRGIATGAGAIAMRETGFRLNDALTEAAGSLPANSPVLALFADLPLLEAADIAAMTAALGEADVVAACDWAGTGTNALLLRQPGLIPYRFGEDSLSSHRDEASTRGLRLAVVQRAGLSSDLDLPADLALLAGSDLSAA